MGGLKQSIKAMLPDSLKHFLKEQRNNYYNKQMIQKWKSIQIQQKTENVQNPEKNFPIGVNLIGDIQAETGLGQSMRILAHILEANQIPFVIIQIISAKGSRLSHNEHEWDRKIVENPVYRTNVIHINADDWAECYDKMPEELLCGRKNIAYWLWELETFPKMWTPCIQTVDEIWAPSDFIKYSIQECTDKEVIKVPYSIRLNESVVYDRAHFKIPNDEFLFLIMYDFRSVSERKNPVGMLQAFIQTFTPEEANQNNIGMIVKINHADDPEEMKRLKDKLRDYTHIHYISENLSRTEVESLVAASDVLLSLHRSEGFGLPAAEAMYLGTPVIATNWSATTEFMTYENSCLVDYKMISLKKDIGPYPKGSKWADAFLNQASDYMRMLYEDEDYYQRKQKKAAVDIREKLNDQVVGEIILNHI